MSQTRPRREGSDFAWAPVATILLVTFLGTVNNNIVNVPMAQILRDLDVPLGEGALVVSSWTLTMAVLLPLGGWVGDRIGRRRLFVLSVAALGLAAAGAALAPNLAVLVTFRVLQGAASAGITPTVMALIADLVGPAHRARAVGYWATANGFGIAVGPPLGGLLSTWFGWRSIFWPTAVLAVVAVVMTLRLIPADAGRPQPLEWRGAVSLALGVGLLLSSWTAVPSLGVGSPAVLVLAAGGVLAFAVFALVIRRQATPFLPPSLLLNRTYLVSNTAAFCQMFCLGATLFAVPLYLTGTAGQSAPVAGALVFALPAAMTLLAPLSGRTTRRWGSTATIRAGLLLLGAAQVLLGVLLVAGAGRGADLVAVLLLAGLGVSGVQTPAAHDATVAAGRIGAGLGLFSVFRFAGSTCGAAWVAVVLSAHGSFGLLFAGCATMAALALAVSLSARRTEVAPAALPDDAATSLEPVLQGGVRAPEGASEAQ
ncbi:MAG: transporter [Frankiales bacterium]|jgi:MFS family permease|nr:transporter [Frankiales bacterium]MCW2584820.1 transporter [Frankiales bacterium]